MNTGIKANKKYIWLIVFLLAVVQLLSFISKLPLKDDQPIDLRQLWVSSSLLKEAANPYDDGLIKNHWKALVESEGIKSTSQPGAPENFSVYPPHVLWFFSLFPRLSWHMIGAFWQLFLAVWMLFLLISEGLLTNWKIPFIYLAFKSFFSAFEVGQPILLILPAFAFLLKSEQNQQPLLSAFWLMVISVKINLLIPVLVWMLARSSWKAVVWAATLGLLWLLFFTVNASINLYELFYAWFGNLSQQWQAAYISAEQNQLRFLVTDIFVPIRMMFGISVGPVFHYALLLTGSVFLFRYFKRGKLKEIELLLGLVLLELLFGYHLIYDLLILIPMLARMDKRMPRWSILLAIPLFVPLNGLFPYLWVKMHLPFVVVLLAITYAGLFLRRPQELENGSDTMH
jgi:hypothetical protein